MSGKMLPEDEERARRFAALYDAAFSGPLEEQGLGVVGKLEMPKEAPPRKKKRKHAPQNMPLPAKPRGRLRLPLHIPQSDQSPEANRQRYMLAIAAAEMNPKGFRQIGKKGGVTKRRRRNRLECLGRSIA